MLFFHKKVFILGLALAVCLGAIFGCSASRKLRAANVLKQCTFEISGASLDSVDINLSRFASIKPAQLSSASLVLLVQNIAKGKIPDSLGTLYFEVQTNVRNASEDTLWLRSAKAEVFFDSSHALPLAIKDSVVALLPGNSEVPLAAKLLIGPQVLKILSADTVRVVGDLTVSLSEDGETIPFHVDEKRVILPEERTAFIDHAREELLSKIIDFWTANFL